MKTFDVQSIEIQAPAGKCFELLRIYGRPGNLPHWTSAFRAVSGSGARMETPHGTVDVELKVAADRERGAIDWTIIFPDGAAAQAFSRVISFGDHAIYSFVPTTPPVPVEQLEGALEQQSLTLKEELVRLRRILEQ